MQLRRPAAYTTKTAFNVALRCWCHLQRWPLRRRFLLCYVLCELFALWRFRLRLARLRIPRLGERRGTTGDLQWILQSMKHSVCPMGLSRASLQRYFPETKRRQKSITWEHYYAIVADAFAIRGPSPDEHLLLMQIAAASAQAQGLPAPPLTSKPPTCRAPVGYGSGELNVVYKPLPLELLIAGIRLLGEAVIRALGFRGRWLPTPEGWMRYWVSRPSDCTSTCSPAVFIHGVGLGAVPYIPLIRKLRQGRQGTLVILELPNCSRSHFQQSMPSPASFRNAFETLLQRELGISSPGSYVLIGHSLGTDYCTMVLNDPRMGHSDSILRPARVVLLDPICFAHEQLDAHRLPFWTCREAIEKTAVWWPLQLAVLFLVIRDEYNQEATKRALVPGTDTIFRLSPELRRRCKILVCLSGNDQALPAWQIHDYVRSQMPDVEVRIDPGLEHGGFLNPLNPGWLAQIHADAMLRFLGVSDVPRVSSHPAAFGGEEQDIPMKRNSRSELCLGQSQTKPGGNGYA